MKRSILLIIVSWTAFGMLFAQPSGGGSLFYEKFRQNPFSLRDAMVVDAFKDGMYPAYLTNYVPVSFCSADASGMLRDVTIFVSPDYVTVGDSSDLFIVPVGPITAQKIADMLECTLPTPKLVDTIYSRSKLKLEPFNYIPRGDRNETPDLLYDHSQVIFALIKASGFAPGVFVAGTKKDIVVTSKLEDSKRSHHVTIYGWHRLNGRAIQPVTNIHIDTYVDYSHGARLVSNRIIIDSKEYNIRDVMRDSVLFKVISYEESPLKRVSYL